MRKLRIMEYDKELVSLEEGFYTVDTREKKIKIVKLMENEKNL